MRKFGILLLVLLVSISSVWAIDGLKLSCWPSSSEDYVVEAGTRIYSDISLTPNTAINNVQVRAEIAGYEYADHLNTPRTNNSRYSDTYQYNDLTKFTHVTDMQAGVKYKELFYFDLPSNMKAGRYLIRYTVSNEDTVASQCISEIVVDRKRHSMEIKEPTITPSSRIKAGDTLRAQYLLYNRGQKDEKAVKVTVSGLDQSYSAFFTLVKSGETETVDMSFSVPSCMKPGKYTLNFKASYDAGYVTINKAVPIEVIAGKDCGKEIVPSVQLDYVQQLSASEQAQISALSPAEREKLYTYVQQMNGASKEEIIKAYAADLSVSEKLAYLEKLPSSERNEVVSKYLGYNLRSYLEIGLLILVVLLILIIVIVGIKKKA